ncbi:hypothetical protein DMP17_22175 [Pseudonocardia sp. TMWB2A]|uniref:hypothetical protein n=1 Tax=Pseudonocardia sp. TMWB2A TaxID=687430 RepID=UPI00307EB539
MADKDPNEEIWAKHPVADQPKRMLRKKFELLSGADNRWEEVDAPDVDVPTGIVRHPDLPAEQQQDPAPAEQAAGAPPQLDPAQDQTAGDQTGADQTPSAAQQQAPAGGKDQKKETGR